MKPKRVPIFAVTVAVALTVVTGASLGKGGGGHGGCHGGGYHLICNTASQSLTRAEFALTIDRSDFCHPGRG
jgi:hypothetical protein